MQGAPVKEPQAAGNRNYLFPMSKEYANQESSDKPREFNLNGWFTERCYSSERFAPIPKGPGLYALLDFDVSSQPLTWRVLYIGMSKNIRRRLRTHAIFAELNKVIDVFVYFKPLNENLRTTERGLIKKFNPPYNIQHRQRGL